MSRPLFIEEHGLRLLLDTEGVGVELSRQSYEAGDWSCAVAEAYAKGKEAKNTKREIMGGEGLGVDRDGRDREGKALAGRVLDWVKEWWADDHIDGRAGSEGEQRELDEMMR